MGRWVGGAGSQDVSEGRPNPRQHWLSESKAGAPKCSWRLEEFGGVESSGDLEGP